LLAVRPAPAAAPARDRINFDEGWRFTKGDPEGTAEQLHYTKLKPWVMPAGTAFTTTNPPAPRPDAEPAPEVPWIQPSFDDTSWRGLNLPHDWGVEGAFKQELPGNTGRLPWAGVAWYRKHFTIPAADAGREFRLEMDGAMAYATVWLNGRFVGGWPYGYSSFVLNLTPFVKVGGENVLAVRLENLPSSSRWYPGGGIYRNVWLLKTGRVHVGQWGTFVTTPTATKDAAQINLQTRVENDSAEDATIQVSTEIFPLDSAGKPGRRAPMWVGTDLKVGARATADTSQIIAFRRPALWSVAHPNRYAAVTTIKRGNEVLDTYQTTFGIRSIEFMADRGFLLNGERLPLNGVCDHHDLGALGAAINQRGIDRQVELLKEMGCNAIRTSHNPPAPELLEACDRLGMVVMDEAFDCWLRAKSRNDYHLLFTDWHEQDLRALIRRDRNHPCVILWSIGNEIPEQGSPAGVRIGAELAAIVQSEDTTRLVTSACDHRESAFDGFQKNLGAFGYNYKPTGYERAREANPSLPIFGSETASTITSRGVYAFPVEPGIGVITEAGRRRGTNATAHPPGLDTAAHQISSWDIYYPPWASSPDMEFAGQERNPSVAGEFVWTGFDYLGEPTPWGGGNDPSRSSYFGILDLAGFKKDRFFLYQAHWRPDYPMAHLLPHWTWPDRVGQPTTVMVYTSGDEAELFLNGKSLGRKTKAKYEYRLRWDDVPYQPGELKTVAYKGGRRWAQDSVRTAGAPARLKISADRTKLSADGRDLSYLTVRVVDAAGVLVPDAHNHIQFSLEGPAGIAATDNGDATSFEPFQAPEHDAFHGLALGIVRTQSGKAGAVKVSVKSSGLAPATIRLQSR